ncbi:MAG: MFS transporter [Janthinobacterium lividum]
MNRSPAHPPVDSGASDDTAVTQVEAGTQGAALPKLTTGLIMMFAFCCGAIVANIYYAQPLIALIAPDIGLSNHLASLIVSLTQVGYGVGLIFLVPLGDLLENRRLMITTLLLSIICLAGAATTHAPYPFLVLCMLIGFSSVSVQMIIPIAATMADNASRGRVVGTVMSGLLFGILLSRPIASLIADHFGWRAVFGFASVLMIAIVVLLGLVMPRRHPGHTSTYGQLLVSLVTLLRRFALLRQRTFYQAMMFGTMILFWTAVPVELARHYGYSQSQIALFGVLGAAGIFFAPQVGRLADAGHSRLGTLVAMIMAVLSFLPSLLWPSLGVIGLGITAVVLDLSVQTSMVIGQREIYGLDNASRSRLNSIYVAGAFIGGSAGAAMASGILEQGGWVAIAIAGVVLVGMGLLKFLFDQRSTLRQGSAQ